MSAVADLSVGPLIYDLGSDVEGSDRFVIFDRDNTLVVDRGYTYLPEDLVWRDGATEVLQRLRACHVDIYIATNQSGVARGLFTIHQMESFHERMQADATSFGVPLRAVAACPHHPEGSIAELAVVCRCRKPRPGMYAELMNRFGLDPINGLSVGDSPSDREASRLAGIPFVSAVDSTCWAQIVNWAESQQ